MRLKLKNLTLLFISAFLLSGFVVGNLGAASVYAVVPGDATCSTTDCSGDNNADPSLKSGNCSDINKCDLINKYITPFINFLTALVGLAVVISIVVGGIQYGSSAGDPAKVTAAKNRIRNALLALITFLFLLALINFIVPGGLY